MKTDSIKINIMEFENVKRIKAVKIEPTSKGLTIIGGKNGQGKTSVLDAIAWALGGNDHKPSKATREGSVIPPTLKVVMSNGLVIERKGKNSDLKVTDPNGQKGGQQILKEFVEELAINLPRFMNSTNKEKADTLLKIIGVGDKLFELEKKEKEAYNKRTAIGQIADQKTKFAKEQPYFPDAPKEPVSAAELIKQEQDILALNGENERKRQAFSILKHQKTDLEAKIERTKEIISDLKERLEKANNELKEQGKSLADLESDIVTASKTVEELKDESTEAIEESIEKIDEINRKVRANCDKDKAEEDAKDYENQYANLTTAIEDIRKQKADLLNNASLPLPELSVVDGELTYKGQCWDNMSGSEQLIVSTAIVRALNPKCGFVLLDKLEQLDTDTLNEFGEWLDNEGLQAIATRVSTGDECSIIIEDGYVKKEKEAEQEDKKATPEIKKLWKAGEF